MLVIILILSVLMSGSLALLLPNHNKTKLKLFISFSGAYLFTITISKLIPEIYQTTVPLNIGFFILIGFFIQVLLEFLSHGIEHGHTHEHHKHSVTAFTVSTGLFIHAFFEGMPLANPQLDYRNSLLAGIVMHNLPIGFAYAAMLLQWNFSKLKTTAHLILFSLMSPLGILCCPIITGFTHCITEKQLYAYIMAIVVGIFLHISTTILYESSEDHIFNRRKLLVIALGAIVAMIS